MSTKSKNNNNDDDLILEFTHANYGNPVKNLIWFSTYDNGKIGIGLNLNSWTTVSGRYDETMSLKKAIELRDFLNTHIEKSTS